MQRNQIENGLLLYISIYFYFYEAYTVYNLSKKAMPLDF